MTTPAGTVIPRVTGSALARDFTPLIPTHAAALALAAASTGVLAAAGRLPFTHDTPGVLHAVVTLLLAWAVTRELACDSQFTGLAAVPLSAAAIGWLGEPVLLVPVFLLFWTRVCNRSTGNRPRWFDWLILAGVTALTGLGLPAPGAIHWSGASNVSGTVIAVAAAIGLVIVVPAEPVSLADVGGVITARGVRLAWLLTAAVIAGLIAVYGSRAATIASPAAAIAIYVILGHLHRFRSQRSER